MATPTEYAGMTTFSKQDLSPNGWIALVHDFVPEHQAVMDALVASLPLKSERLRIMGREVATPRLTSWHGDSGAGYRYSGRYFEPNPWTAELDAVRDRLEALLGVRFNSVLANYYRDGRDSMGFHTDAEPELGPNSPDDVLIASVSLGAPRRFVLQSKGTKERRVFDLGEGSLFVMGGAVQKHWRHGVPKTTRKVGPRLNLTFRTVR
ncbi:MAG: alpha-ketoglutarate-dependent dioxygenase AlkB [Sandaracinaceae bacterium]|nr:alpha-ketoglutarate-dependent dioxygenase AlkB [Sandaracinaceae bacterium]